MGLDTIMSLEIDTFFKPRRKIKRTFPTGTVLFTGRQGAGKSLSASHYLHRLKKKYPELYIYSNIHLTIADKVIKADEISKYILDIKYNDKGEQVPIAFFLDEIQTVLFNSKKAVSLETFKAICQQRKALKTIIGTMQEFLDLDIRYRRQLQAQVECSSFLNVQIETWKDPETMKLDKEKGKYIGAVKKRQIWKRHNIAYDLYDTYEIVSATMDIDTIKQQTFFKPDAPIVGVAPT